jgi:hypothetical protein
MEWQTMDTAPKDGSYILAVIGQEDDRYVSAHKGRMFCVRFQSGGWSVYPGYGGVADARFSHWMPLPEPPK